MMLIDTKYFFVHWEASLYKTRKFKFKHRSDVKSVYLQVFNLEIAGWYGDTSRGS